MENGVSNFNQDATVDPQCRRTSLDSSTTFNDDLKPTNDKHASNAAMNKEKEPSKLQQQQQPIQPSIRLLYSLVSQRDAFLFLLPALAAAVIAGSVAPFMTFVVGQAFDTFAKFPTSDPTPEDKAALRHGVGIAAIELVALAAGTLAMSSITSALWVTVGERNVLRLRKKVYEAISNHDLEWFDKGMGSEEQSTSAEGEDSVGAGGLMSKFARYVFICAALVAIY